MNRRLKIAILVIVFFIGMIVGKYYQLLTH